tara:strand:+ start:61 stop:231 length:171 start_codon:yes stop_codon:yes gene_type:complete
MAMDHNNLPCQVPNIDTLQYVGANNEDTSRQSTHTSEVRDSHSHFDEASLLKFFYP